jgi:hypothetical protein
LKQKMQSVQICSSYLRVKELSDLRQKCPDKPERKENYQKGRLSFKCQNMITGRQRTYYIRIRIDCKHLSLQAKYYTVHIPDYHSWTVTLHEFNVSLKSHTGTCVVIHFSQFRIAFDTLG